MLSVCDVALSKNHSSIVYPWGLVGVEWICSRSWCFFPLERPTSDLRFPCLGWHTPLCRQAAPRQSGLRPVLRASLGLCCSSSFAWQFCLGCWGWGVLITSLVQLSVFALTCFLKGKLSTQSRRNHTLRILSFFKTKTFQIVVLLFLKKISLQFVEQTHIHWTIAWEAESDFLLSYFKRKKRAAECVFTVQTEWHVTQMP